MFAISNHRFPIWLPPAQLQSYWVNMMPNIFRWWNRITTLRDQACMQGANITSVFQRRHVVLPCHLIWFVFVDLQPHVVPFRLIRLAALCQHCDRHSQVSGEPTVSSMAYCYTGLYLPWHLALACFGEAYLNISEDEFVLSTSATWCTAFKFAIQSQGKLVPCS